MSLEIPDNTSYLSKSNWNTISLTEWFDETTKTNEFIKECGYVCKNWNKTTSISKSLKISRLPELLVVHLKRFNIDGEEASKNRSKIEISKELLEIAQYIHPQLGEVYSKVKYNLYAIVNHSGSLKSGHYTATIKNRLGDNKWYKWNDKHISEITKLSFTSENFYMLFYYRTKTDEKLKNDW